MYKSPGGGLVGGAVRRRLRWPWRFASAVMCRGRRPSPNQGMGCSAASRGVRGARAVFSSPALLGISPMFGVAPRSNLCQCCSSTAGTIGFTIRFHVMEHQSLPQEDVHVAKGPGSLTKRFWLELVDKMADNPKRVVFQSTQQWYEVL